MTYILPVFFCHSFKLKVNTREKQQLQFLGADVSLAINGLLSFCHPVCPSLCMSVCLVCISVWSPFPPISLLPKLINGMVNTMSYIFHNLRCFTGRMINHLETCTHTGTLLKERKLARSCCRTAFITGGKTLQNMN